MQTLKRERELMAKTDFVPHVLENNNGEPAYRDEDELEARITEIVISMLEKGEIRK